ncbi:hypothetical protein GCM10011331_02690 [Flavimobilis marinus]|nr:hypothetical protein GCM10011331_02690 [Flavimobilis marinus]
MIVTDDGVAGSAAEAPPAAAGATTEPVATSAARATEDIRVRSLMRYVHLWSEAGTVPDPPESVRIVPNLARLSGTLRRLWTTSFPAAGPAPAGTHRVTGNTVELGGVVE